MAVPLEVTTLHGCHRTDVGVPTCQSVTVLGHGQGGASPRSGHCPLTPLLGCCVLLSPRPQPHCHGLPTSSWGRTGTRLAGRVWAWAGPQESPGQRSSLRIGHGGEGWAGSGGRQSPWWAHRKARAPRAGPTVPAGAQRSHQAPPAVSTGVGEAPPTGPGAQDTPLVTDDQNGRGQAPAHAQRMEMGLGIGQPHR